MESLIIIGASGHGKVICDAARRAGWTVLGFLDRDPPAAEWCGRPVLGDDTGIARLLSEHPEARIVVGVGDNSMRRSQVGRVVARAPGCGFAAVVHPSAVIAEGVEIGPGSVVMAGAILNPGVRVGAHCIVNTGAIVEHDCELGDYATVSPGASLGGGVRLGEGCVVGIGATVLHGRAIGDHTVAGAGALVTKDLPAGVVAYGVPAKVIRARAAGEGYL